MIIDFMKGLNKKIAIAVGFFDSVHIGHRFLINNTVEISKVNNIDSAVFTFKDNLYNSQGSALKQIYSFHERQEILHSLGVDYIISASANGAFLSLEPKEFLEKLTTLYDIDTIICGSDFRYGKNAKGDIDFLVRYAKDRGIKVKVYDFVKYNDNKVSSRDIRDLLNKGNIKKANTLLGEPFFIRGKVVKGSGRGKLLGYPTANINPESDKVGLLEGVYVTSILLDDKRYKSITNVGRRPTFCSDEIWIESYIEDYKGNLYEKDIKVLFYERIRDTKKFNSQEELIDQISKDLQISNNTDRSIYS